ncbi:GNAT family N-acetyltransferase [Erysipelothrix urinaevulpis]|uniref:GNAT family N-acetyltransferase n=1 Tax=Erysipelothrix urinaevulpis TaxID=2683717 RepID=UPI00135C568A|nr:GNAT family N-acetyltransferase [Erysipelothrix urinaevulpis]
MNEFTIVPYSNEYSKDLNKVRTCKDVYPNLLSMPYESEAETQAYFEGKNKFNTLAVVDGKAIAYAQLRLSKNVRKKHKAQISIAVHPDHYRKKIGYHLMKEIIEIGDKWLDLHKLDLTVLQSNTPAVQLYKKLGFVIEGDFKEDTIVNGTYEDVYYMGLMLKNKEEK